MTNLFVKQPWGSMTTKTRKTNIYTAGTTCVVPETMFDGCLEVYAAVTNGLLLRTAVRIIDKMGVSR